MAEGNSPSQGNPTGVNAQTDTLETIENQSRTFQTFDPRIVDNVYTGFDTTLCLDFYDKYNRYLNPSSEDSDPDFPPSQRYKKYTDKGMNVVIPVELTRPPYSEKTDDSDDEGPIGDKNDYVRVHRHLRIVKSNKYAKGCYESDSDEDIPGEKVLPKEPLLRAEKQKNVRGITGILAHDRCEIKLCYYYREYKVQREKGINVITWCSRNTGVDDPTCLYLHDNPSTFFFDVHNRLETYALYRRSFAPLDRSRYYSFDRPIFYTSDQTKKGKDNIRLLAVLKENSTSPASLFQLSTVCVMKNLEMWHRYKLKGWKNLRLPCTVNTVHYFEIRKFRSKRRVWVKV